MDIYEGIVNNEEPIFEIHAKNGHIYKIWANGQIAGFEADCSIVNRYPIMIQSVIAQSVKNIIG